MTTHHIPNRRDGHNTRKLRMLFGYEQQETFAKRCRWSQQKMSKLERQEVINSEDLNVIADVLGIPAEKIIAFDEVLAVHAIQSDSKTDVSTVNHQRVEPPSYQDGSAEKILEALNRLTKTVADLAARVAELKSGK